LHFSPNELVAPPRWWQIREVNPVSPHLRTRLLVADDHASVRAGLGFLLADEPHFEIVGESHSVETTLRAIEEWVPDIVLLDYRLGAESADRVLAELVTRANAPRVLMLSMEDEHVVGQEMIRRGATAYVAKHAPTVEILAALHRIRDTLIAERSGAAATPRTARNGAVHLTKREHQVLLLLKAGLPSKSIARRLLISDKTVDVHTHQLRRKLNLRTQLDLVRHATLFVPDESTAQADTAESSGCRATSQMTAVPRS
jgi:DNA-binding NarL/FixJ family response regulator